MMGGLELFVAGMAGLALLSVIVRARAGMRRARVAAEIARMGTSPVSLLGRVLVNAGVIVGAQWAVIAYAENRAWVWVVLAVPALVTSYTLTKALTVVTVSPSRRRAGDRR